MIYNFEKKTRDGGSKGRGKGDMVHVRKGSRRVGGFLHGTNNRCRRRTALLMAIDTMTGRIYNTEEGSQMNRG